MRGPGFSPPVEFGADAERSFKILSDGHFEKPRSGSLRGLELRGMEILGQLLHGKLLEKRTGRRRHSLVNRVDKILLGHR